MTFKVLISEKPSVSKAIKEALQEDYKELTHISLRGHILDLKFKTLNNIPWMKTSLEKLIEDPLIFYTKEDSGSKELKKLAKTKKDIDQLILAMDPDVEGHRIATESVQFLSKNLKIKKISSMILDSMAKKDLQKAYHTRINYEEKKSYQGEARARLDFIFGTFLTRFGSLTNFKNTKKWYTFYSGRVKTPCLYKIYQRNKQREGFKQKKTYIVKININSLEYPLDIKELETKQQAENILNQKLSLKVSNGLDYVVSPREGLNTTDFLTLLAKEHAVFKDLSKPTISLINNMYLSGKITYPRVDNRSYYKYKPLYDEIGSLYQKETNNKAIKEAIKIPKNMTPDHMPISPLVLTNEVEDELEKKVLKTLYGHLKKMFSGPNYYKCFYINLKTPNEEIRYRVLKVVKKNYEDQVRSSITFDQKLYEEERVIENIPYIEQKEHKPPSLYTSSSLLKEMDRLGIGTKATRSKIIQDLKTNKFLISVASKLQITPLGIQVIDFWLKRYQNILSSQMTKNLEMEFLRLEEKHQVANLEEKYRLLLTQLLQNKTEQKKSESFT